MIGVAVVSDRGDLYLPDCLAALATQLPAVGVGGPHVVDDSSHHLGMAGAVRAAWGWALDQPDLTHLLHWEEDFLASARVPVFEMAAILDKAPRLAQVVLLRQAWSVAERTAGGIVEMAPDEYEDRSVGAGCEFVEHGRVGDCGFSLNPCLIPRRVLELGWPDGNEAEFTSRCEAEGLRFAFYGRRSDAPRVSHVGEVRASGWRL